MDMRSHPVGTIFDSGGIMPTKDIPCFHTQKMLATEARLYLMKRLTARLKGFYMRERCHCRPSNELV
jgi:hypothetical protein